MSAETHPAPGSDWVKSSYSGGNATECVEAAFVPAGILIRDSKCPEGPWIAVSAQAWNWFVDRRCPGMMQSGIHN